MASTAAALGVFGELGMISAARFLGLAAACATLLLVGAWAESASAQEQACKSDAVTATGRAKFRPFGKTKELEGRGSAMADAVANSQREVTDRYGDEWGRWSKAKDTSFDCAPTKSGKIIGSSFIGCSVTGRPCSPGALGGKAVVQDDDRDGEARGRRGDKGRRVAEEDRPYQGSRAYRRAMTHQSYLAAARRRAESRAYERAMSRQEYLAAARRRAEAAGWARVNARQRYLAEVRDNAE
jgi:hypothetical protein